MARAIFAGGGNFDFRSNCRWIAWAIVADCTAIEFFVEHGDTADISDNERGERRGRGRFQKFGDFGIGEQESRGVELTKHAGVAERSHAER